MQYKVLLAIILAAGGSVLILNMEHKPVCTIAQAERRQFILNSSRREFQCGRWMVNRHADGEGRVFYALENCAVPAWLRNSIEQGNEHIEAASSLAEIDKETELLEENVMTIGAYQRAQKQAKGIDAAVRNLYKGIYR